MQWLIGTFFEKLNLNFYTQTSDSLLLVNELNLKKIIETNSQHIREFE